MSEKEATIETETTEPKLPSWVPFTWIFTCMGALFFGVFIGVQSDTVPNTKPLRASKEANLNVLAICTFEGTTAKIGDAVAPSKVAAGKCVDIGPDWAEGTLGWVAEEWNKSTNSWVVQLSAYGR
jgi:hypothetical protein